MFGSVVFDERLLTSGARLTFELVGLTTMVAGLIKLAVLAAGQPAPDALQPADAAERR
jgi:hypothetical protein